MLWHRDGNGYLALMRCQSCRHETGWRRFSSLELLVRGERCPACSHVDTNRTEAVGAALPWVLQLVPHQASVDVFWSSFLQVADLVSMHGPDCDSKAKSVEWARRTLVQMGVLTEGEALPASRVFVANHQGA